MKAPSINVHTGTCTSAQDTDLNNTPTTKNTRTSAQVRLEDGAATSLPLKPLQNILKLETSFCFSANKTQWLEPWWRFSWTERPTQMHAVWTPRQTTQPPHFIHGLTFCVCLLCSFVLPKKPSKSTPVHDAVAAALSHRHHLIIQVRAIPIQIPISWATTSEELDPWWTARPLLFATIRIFFFCGWYLAWSRRVPVVKSRWRVRIQPPQVLWEGTRRGGTLSKLGTCSLARPWGSPGTVTIPQYSFL